METGVFSSVMTAANMAILTEENLEARECLASLLGELTDELFLSKPNASKLMLHKCIFGGSSNFK